MRSVRPFLAPQLRGHVQPRVVDHLARTGWHVHRIGQAAYIHGPGGHFLLGVWGRRAPAPAWAARLGAASEGWWRRVDRCERVQRTRFLARSKTGQFVGRLPWWRAPGPRVYSWIVPWPSLVDAERAAADENRRRMTARWVT